MAAAAQPDGVNRAAITACVILATLMQALDTTIANVALPYIQGSVSASQDQIDWVLTSYIVAAAIMTPPTGFLAGRFGRKRLFLVAVAGFTVASMLCGMAQSLSQIVLFRILQGVFGAALVPLSQSVLLDIYPQERQGSAMALFGVAVMVGPVLGPVLGGWLTENYSWRWVFYINLPIGVARLRSASSSSCRRPSAMRREARLVRLRHAEPRDRRPAGHARPRRAARLVRLRRDLDRGDRRRLGLLPVPRPHLHRATSPSCSPALFRDRNFAAGMLFIFVIGVTYLASLALLTPYLQNLMDYPVVTAGS